MERLLLECSCERGTLQEVPVEGASSALGVPPKAIPVPGTWMIRNVLPPLDTLGQEELLLIRLRTFLSSIAKFSITI